MINKSLLAVVVIALMASCGSNQSKQNNQSSNAPDSSISQTTDTLTKESVENKESKPARDTSNYVRPVDNTILYCWMENVRLVKEPKFMSAKVAEIKKDEKVTYLNESSGFLEGNMNGNLLKGQWIKVKTKDSKEGWAFAGSFLCEPIAPKKPMPVKPSMAKGVMMYVPKKEEISLYDGPSFANKLLIKVSGTQGIEVFDSVSYNLPCIQQNQIWYRIKYNIDGKTIDCCTFKGNLLSKKAFFADMKRDFTILENYFPNTIDTTYNYVLKQNDKIKNIIFNFETLSLTLQNDSDVKVFKMLDVYRLKKTHFFTIEANEIITYLKLQFQEDGDINVEYPLDFTGIYKSDIKK